MNEFGLGVFLDIEEFLLLVWNFLFKNEWRINQGE
jgi:hypothetical protein